MNRLKQFMLVRGAIILALWVPLIFTLVLAGLAFRGQRDRDLDSQWVLHTIKTRDQIQRLYSLVKDVETSERGYLLTANTNCLVPYDRARQEIPIQSEKLARLIADNPRQVAAVARLQVLITEKLSLVAQTLELAGQGKMIEAVRLVTEGRGREFMEEMRVQVNAIAAEEDQLLAAREKDFAAQVKFQKILMTILISADISLILVAIFLIQLSTKSQQKSNTRTDEANTRTDEANTRTDEANTRTDEANTREQQSLRASELTYRRLFEAAQDGILILDMDTGRITDVNPFLCDLLGFSRAEMIGNTVGELSPFKDIEENKVMLARLQKDRYVRYEDLPLEAKDGRQISVEFVSNVYEAGDHNVIQCNIRDITKSKIAEEALRTSEARYRALFEYAPDGIVIANPESYYIDANETICRMLGYSRNELVAMHASDIVIDTEIQHIKPALTTIKARSDYKREWQFRRKDGSVFTAEVIATMMPDGNLLGMIRDVTESKQAEDLLKASFKEISDLKFALDQHAIVSITDSRGIITYANDKFCAVSKYPRAELLGQTHAILKSGHHSKEFIRDLWMTIEHDRVWQGEFKNRAKDGSFYWVNMTIVPFLNDQGKPRQYVSIRTEITEQKAAEEKIHQLNAELERRVAERTAQLETVNAELETFSYSVSHDLRAPLRHVLGFVDLLQNEAGPALNEKNLRYLETIAESARRMGKLIDDLLAFSRVGRSTLQKSDINLDELVREVMGDFQAETQARKIVWQINPLPVVSADRALLRLVLVNLMANAVKFTGQRAEARIEIGEIKGEGRASRDESQADLPSTLDPRPSTTIFIRDNGAGFDPEYVGKLFGVFQRLHSQDEFEGTGIGLANVQRIIQRHGGRVWAEGVVAGGATFYFSIPKQPNGGSHEH